jgi:predicted GNAT family N-acyltransferase
MLYSIQLGCRSLPECDAFFLLPGDMPVIKKSTFEKVLEVWKANSYDIVFPTVDGSRKHPPLIAASLIPEILQFHGEGGLRQLWKRYGDRIGLVPVDDKGTGMDLDTREDYRFCKEQYEIGAVKTNDSKGVTGAMTIEIFHTLPEAAVSIRKKVFMEEQGFQKEFDEIDERAVHLVLFDDKGAAAATCRVFYDTALESYILGRLAVVKEYRGQKLGAAMIAEAEKYVCSVQGEYLALHAQCRVKEFYQKMGFREYGEVEDDEGCPHIWMKKKL